MKPAAAAIPGIVDDADNDRATNARKRSSLDASICFS
jgi:hypothetical protein